MARQGEIVPALGLGRPRRHAHLQAPGGLQAPHRGEARPHRLREPHRHQVQRLLALGLQRDALRRHAALRDRRRQDRGLQILDEPLVLRLAGADVPLRTRPGRLPEPEDRRHDADHRPGRPDQPEPERQGRQAQGDVVPQPFRAAPRDLGHVSQRRHAMGRQQPRPQAFVRRPHPRLPRRVTGRSIPGAGQAVGGAVRQRPRQSTGPQRRQDQQGAGRGLQGVPGEGLRLSQGGGAAPDQRGRRPEGRRGRQALPRRRWRPGAPGGAPDAATGLARSPEAHPPRGQRP